MNCVQAEEHFSAHLEDTLDYETLQDFESHLTACETCQGEYARFQDSVNAVQQLPQVEPSPYFMSTLQQRLRTEESETGSIKTRWYRLLDVFRRPKWAISGVIAMILAVTGTYFYQDLRPASVLPTPRTEQIATSPEVFPVQPPRRVVGNSNQLLRGSVISTPTEPMQQRYMLKQVSYTTASTSGGL